MKKSIEVIDKQDCPAKDLLDEVGICNQSSKKKKLLMSSFFIKNKSTSSPNMNNYIIQHNNQREIQLQQQQQLQQQNISQQNLNQNSSQNNNILNNSNSNNNSFCSNNSNNINTMKNSNSNININSSNNSSSSNNNHSVTVKVGNSSGFLKKSLNMATPLSSSTVINSLVDNNSTSTSNSSTPRSTSDEDDDDCSINQMTATDEASTPLSSSPDSEPEELLRRARRSNRHSKSLTSALDHEKHKQKLNGNNINHHNHHLHDIIKENSNARTSTSSTISDLSTISSGIGSSSNIQNNLNQINSNNNNNINNNDINKNLNEINNNVNNDSSNNNNININNININNINNNSNSNSNINSNSNNQLNSSTSSTNSYKSNIIITSKPSSEKSWEMPENLTISKCKELASKDNEFILSILSSIQKQLQQQPSSPTTSSVSSSSSPTASSASTSSLSNLTQQNDDIEIEKYEKKCKARHDTLVILEILKQFNLGFDMIDNDCGSVESLSVADEMERKTFLLAKKMLFLKMEMNKPNITEKRTFIIYTIISTVANFMATGNIPSEIISIPFEMTISLGQSTSLLPHINSQVYKKGHLIKKKSRALGNRFSNKWVVLTHSELLVYSNEKEEQLLIKKPLNEISSIVLTPLVKEGYNNAFTIYFSNIDNNEITEEWNLSTGSLTSLGSNNQLSTSNSSNGSNNGNNNSLNNNSNSNSSNNGNNMKKSNNKQIVFCSDNNEEMVNWVLAIDGVSNSNFKSTMDLAQKEQYLNLNKKNHRGGSFRFGEEEWIYCDGKLTNNCWGDTLEYIWDGCTLVASVDSKIFMGKGRWNGVWLTWYSEEKIKEPYIKYLYQPSLKQFTFDSFPIRSQFSWTLSRHFLVSSSGIAGGEWIIEGDVPPALVMLVQMMKYYKAGK